MNPLRSVALAALVVSSMVVGSVAFAGSAAAHSGSTTITVSSADETTGSGESTIYTVRIQNHGSKQTFTVEPNNVPDGWSVSDQQSFDPNNYKQVTIGSGETKSVSFSVSGSNGGFRTVGFGVWHCGFGGCLVNAKGHWVGSGSAGHTVDATGPTIDAGSSVDGRELTVSAEVTDTSGVDSVELVYGGLLGIGEKRVTLENTGGDTYETTIELDWGDSAEFHIAATDVYGNQDETRSVTREVETNDAPSITNVRSEVDNTELTIRADVSDSQNLRTVDLTYGTGGLLPGGEETVAMRNVGGDTYEKTIDLDWGESTEFHVSASDVYGKDSQSNSYTREVETNDAPSITNIRTSSDGTELTVKADVSDSQGVEAVDLVYGTEGLLGIGSQTVAMYSTDGDTYEATIDDLDWGDSTQFHVSARDIFEKSAESDDQRASVESDGDAPNIGNVDVNYDGKTVTVTADVSDDTSGVSSVDVIYDTGWANFGGTTVTMSKDSGDTYRGTFQVDYGENFEYRIEASDNAGNNGETNTREATVPRGTAVFAISNNDDEEKEVELRIDGDTRRTVTVPAGKEVGRTIEADPGGHTLGISYTEQDNGETYTSEASVSVPQSGSSTGEFTVPERLAPEITLSCSNSCSFGTYDPKNESPTLRLNVGNAGGGELEWDFRSPMFNAVGRGDDYVIVEPTEVLIGEFSETATVSVENERYEGDPTAEIELSGLGTAEPGPPSVDIVSSVETVRSGVPTSIFSASVESGTAGSTDQPEPVSAEEHVVTWYADGEQIAQSTPDPTEAPGALDQPTFTIEGSGTMTIKVVAEDPNTEKKDSENTTVDVGEVNGEITGYTTPDPGSTYELDRWYKVGVEVQNTGDVGHTFAVEAPERTGRETKTTRKNVTLAPGASKVVTFEQRFYGTYTQTRAFRHELIDDVETERSSDVIDESTLELDEPSNGELFLEPNTGDGEPATIDVTLVGDDGTVVLDERVLTDGTDVEAKQFDVPSGEYELTMNAEGYRSRTTDVTVSAGTETVVRPLLAPEGVDASVVSAEFAGNGPYGTGDTVSSDVTVENTGDKRWEFFVGYSVRPNGTDLEYTQEGQTGTFVELDPGETETVTVEWRVDEAAGGGSYDAATAVWYGYPEDGANMIEFVGWRSDRFDVTKEARTERITYDGTTYTVSFNPDNTVAVYDSERELVPDERAKSVLGYMAFLNYSTDLSVSEYRDHVNQSTDLESYYWAAHLNQAGITAFKAYVNAHFGSYKDGLGEYIDLMSQATRLMKEQGGTAGIGAELHRLSNISAEAYTMYDNKQKVEQYASLVKDAYRVKKATEGADSMSEAVDIARKTDAGSDAKTGVRDLVISQAMRPMTDVNAGLKVTSQQSLLASHWGKSAKPIVEMLGELREKRAAGTITRSEMKLYYILQTRYWGGLALTWDRMSTLQKQGEQQSTAFSVISDVNGNSPEEYANMASGFRNLTGLKMEQMGAYLNRSDTLYNHSANLYTNPETSALGAGEPLVVSSPGWVEPGEDALVHVESRGDPVINAEVHVGDTVVETNRNGNATVSLWERGSYRATVEKDGFESAETAWVVREPQVAARSLSNVNLGEIRNNENPTGRSTFENTGETTLEIESVSAEHPAITATVESGAAAPSETLGVGVSADADELDEGTFSTNVTVEWAGTEGTTSFLVTGEQVRRFGTLAVETNPVGASVRVDGEPRGSAPVELELPAGDHTLTIDAESYRATTRTVSVTGGETTSKTIELTAENTPPTVSVVANRTTLPSGEAVEVTANASDPDGDELAYRWDTDGDGAFDDGQGPDLTLRPEEGQQTVRVEVSDGTADPVTDSATLTVTNTEAPDFEIERFDLSPVGSDGLELVVDPTTDTLDELVVELETADGTTVDEFGKSAFDREDGAHVLRLDGEAMGTYTARLRTATGPDGASTSGASDTVTLEGDGSEREIEIGAPEIEERPDANAVTVNVPIENTGDAAHEVAATVDESGSVVAETTTEIGAEENRILTLDAVLPEPRDYTISVDVMVDGKHAETFERTVELGDVGASPSVSVSPTTVAAEENASYEALWTVPADGEGRTVGSATVSFGSPAWDVRAANAANVSVAVGGDSVPVVWTERYEGKVTAGFGEDIRIPAGERLSVTVGANGTTPVRAPAETGSYDAEMRLDYKSWADAGSLTVADAEVPAFGISSFDLEADGEDGLTLTVEAMKEADTLRVRLETADGIFNETFEREAFLDSDAPTYRLALDELPAGEYTATLVQAAPVGGGPAVGGEDATATVEGAEDDDPIPPDEPALGVGDVTVSNATDDQDGIVRVPIENTGNGTGGVTVAVRSEGEALTGAQRAIDAGASETIALNLSVEDPDTYPLTVRVTGDGLSETFERELVVAGDPPEPAVTLGPSPVLSGGTTHYRAVWSVPEGAESRSVGTARIGFGSDAWDISTVTAENATVSVNGESVGVDWVERDGDTADIGFAADASVGPGDRVVVRVGSPDGAAPIGVPNTTGTETASASLGDDGWTDTGDIRIVDNRPLIEADLVVTPERAAASVPGEFTYEVAVSNASRGVGAFNATLQVGASAEITDATVLGDPNIGEAETAADNRSVDLTAIGLGTDANNTTLAQVTVRTVESGPTDVSMAVDALGTRAGEAYALGTRNATLTGVDIDPVGPYADPPTDTDGDGVFEDINGDGRANIVDVQAFFDNEDDDAIAAHPARFDFNDNGERDFLDIQALFDELGGAA